MEYLVTMTTHVPDGTPAEAVASVRAREAAHTRELAAQGHVLRLWRPPLAPGEWRTLGLLAAADAAELERVLASMPLRVWRSDEVKQLSVHPNDPLPSASSAHAPAGRRRGGDGGDPAGAAALTVPRDADHAADAAPERPRCARQQGADRGGPWLTTTSS
jgi:muconolactone D-isomerase